MLISNMDLKNMSPYTTIQVSVRDGKEPSPIDRETVSVKMRWSVYIYIYIDIHIIIYVCVVKHKNLQILHSFTEDWLVEFDGDISINMAGLRPLVDQHLARIAVSLGWFIL